MDDLISRQAAIEAIWDGTNMDIYTREVKEILEELPTAEPRKGRWLRGDAEKLALKRRCSACNKAVYEGWNFKFCPNCGARMEESDGQT